MGRRRKNWHYGHYAVPPQAVPVPVPVVTPVPGAAPLHEVVPVPATQLARSATAAAAPTTPAVPVKAEVPVKAGAMLPPRIPVIIDDDGDAVIDLTGDGPYGGAASSSSAAGSAAASAGTGGLTITPFATPNFPAWGGLGWGSATGRAAPAWSPPTEATKGGPDAKRAKLEPGAATAGSPDDNPDTDVCFGQFISTLKGMQHYRGVISHGEMVVLVREPTNPYDRNAIRACNVINAQVGHVCREHAAVLSPLLDRGQITIEGVIMGSGSADKYQTSVVIRVFGQPEQRKTVQDHFNRNYTQLRPYSDPLAPKAAPVTQQLEPQFQAEWSTPIEIPNIKDNLDQVYQQQQEMLKNIPPLDGPDGMKSKLLEYQKQGLGWLVSQEELRVPTEGKPVYFWSHNPRTRLFSHALTSAIVAQAPELPRGGILADEMGLGKTVQMIAMVLRDLNRIRSGEETLPAGVCATTLIICPLSVMSNWTRQIKTHVREGLISVYMYHGPTRNPNPAFLKKHDVILTTYQTVSFALDKQNEILKIFEDICFRRIILDEGHIIRNHASKQSKAACLLRANRRWVISGTPIQNSLTDLYSLVKFLRVPPLNDLAYWKSVFEHKLKGGDQAAYGNLRMFIQAISLRRIKSMQINGQPLVTLPPKQVLLHKVKLMPDEQAIYDQLASDARRTVENYIAEGTLMKYFMNVLALLCGMRQCCDHVTLVAATATVDFRDNVALQGTRLDERTRGLLHALRGGRLRRVLALNANEDCAICLDVMKSPAVTPCAHVFCKACIEAVLKATPACPLCRQATEAKQLFEAPAVPDDGDDDDVGGDDGKKDALLINPEAVVNPSSKIIALLEYLETARQRDPTIKSVVFSQWTRMLDLIESSLLSANFRFCRLDGGMSRKSRDQAIETIENDPTVTVMLVSLTCGNLGLNLVAASQVFVMDPWWNPATEEQAIDRVHRLGQTRPVTVVRFVVENSVEDRVMERQGRKKELIRQTFSGSTDTKEIQLQRLKDIRALFQ